MGYVPPLFPVGLFLNIFFPLQLLIDFAHFFHTGAGFALASHYANFFFNFFLLCSIRTAACPLEIA